MDNAATELVAVFTERLRSSLEQAVSSFASDLADPDIVPAIAARSRKTRAVDPDEIGPAGEWAPKPKKPGRRPKVAKVKAADGKRQNHCRNCHQPGVQTKTCGKTPNHPGTYAGNDRQSGADADDDDEGETARKESPVVHHVASRPAVPVQDRVLAPAPRHAPPPASSRAQPPPPPARPALTSVPLPVVTPAKTVARDKALKEIAKAKEERAAALRKLAAMRKPKLEDFPDKDEPGRAPLPDFDPIEEEDAGELDVGTAIRLGSAQL